MGLKLLQEIWIVAVEAENTHTFSEKLSHEIEEIVTEAVELVVSHLEYHLWEEKLIYSAEKITSANSCNI